MNDGGIMFLVGLTGGIATGKSTVADIFSSRHGVPVVDADAIARRVVAPGRPAHDKLRQQFGEEFFLEGGEVDRAALRAAVAADPAARRRLDSITHPEIYKAMAAEVAMTAMRGHQFAVLDLPLLFETEAAFPAAMKMLHKVVVVTCEEDLQLQRLMAQRGLSEKESKVRHNCPS